MRKYLALIATAAFLALVGCKDNSNKPNEPSYPDWTNYLYGGVYSIAVDSNNNIWAVKGVWPEQIRWLELD